METTQENKLTLTEQALYCAQLMQWAVLSSNKNLLIFCEYGAYLNNLIITIFKKGYCNTQPNNMLLNNDGVIKFYVDELTPAKIKIIQKEIAKILGDAVVH